MVGFALSGSPARLRMNLERTRKRSLRRWFKGGVLFDFFFFFGANGILVRMRLPVWLFWFWFWFSSICGIVSVTVCVFLVVVLGFIF